MTILYNIFRLLLLEFSASIIWYCKCERGCGNWKVTMGYHEVGEISISFPRYHILKKNKVQWKCWLYYHSIIFLIIEKWQKPQTQGQSQATSYLCSSTLHLMPMMISLASPKTHDIQNFRPLLRSSCEQAIVERTLSYVEQTSALIEPHFDEQMLTRLQASPHQTDYFPRKPLKLSKS